VKTKATNGTMARATNQNECDSNAARPKQRYERREKREERGEKRGNRR
jgi:hypothetical protein